MVVLYFLKITEKLQLQISKGFQLCGWHFVVSGVILESTNVGYFGFLLGGYSNGVIMSSDILQFFWLLIGGFDFERGLIWWLIFFLPPSLREPFYEKVCTLPVKSGRPCTDSVVLREIAPLAVNRVEKLMQIQLWKLYIVYGESEWRKKKCTMFIWKESFK